MDDMIVVRFEGKEYKFNKGIALSDLVKGFEKDGMVIVAAKVNNDLKELGYILSEDATIELVELPFLGIQNNRSSSTKINEDYEGFGTKEDGIRIYRRSLHFVLIKAVHDIFPDRKVVISHTISKGMYCEVRGKEDLTQKDVAQIKSRMKEIVDAKIPFERLILSVEEAKKLCASNNREDRALAFEYRNRSYVTMYRCGDCYDYFYGYMVPDTSYIKTFDVFFRAPGLVVMLPKRNNMDVLPEYIEQPKLFNIFTENKKWLKILDVENVGALNAIIKNGKCSELIRIAEALQEKKIANIADMITNSESAKKIVLISGPSSSGKTTFANRLAVQLRVNGKKPITISLDDYFIDRDKTPLDEKGDYDFEALEAIDIELFNKHLFALISGVEVETPVYNFAKGKREETGILRRIQDDNILVIEGIHGLNEKLTRDIPKESKFKIYVSALTSMNLDEHNRIPTTDTRIIRRIVRDNQFRGTSALSTIKRWPSVRRGEEKNIFPFQENADVMFNSSLVYELGVLKTLAEPLLLEIDQSHEEYSEAKRLLEFLSYFLPIDYKETPLNSIIREFVGGSCFYSL